MGLGRRERDTHGGRAGTVSGKKDAGCGMARGARAKSEIKGYALVSVSSVSRSLTKCVVSGYTSVVFTKK